ncbi:MAG: hypothetical protein K9H65_05405 [Bacteroidales bacterium]|nr:hypothetical protein [Bacteroidales bacterium]
MGNFDQLLRKQEAFSSFLNSDYLYTYIAPKDREKYFRFLESIYNSSVSSSLYKMLSDPETVRKLLKSLGYLEDTELEIYVATNDKYSTVWSNCTLQEYIEKENLQFD